jgi:hypothetical protein
MQAYIVRLGETGDGTGQNVHELVGIFCAESIAQLIELVDEFCEPAGMEYAPLGPGGVGWSGRTYDLPLKNDPQYFTADRLYGFANLPATHLRSWSVYPLEKGSSS